MNTPSTPTTIYFRNVPGLSTDAKAADVREEILGERVPTCFPLAETRWSGAEARSKIPQWTDGAYLAFAHRGPTHYSPPKDHGVLLAIPRQWESRVRRVQRIRDRAVRVSLRWPRGRLFLVPVLAPVSGEPRRTTVFATKVRTWLSTAAAQDETVVVVGDMNGVMDPVTDPTFRGKAAAGTRPTTVWMETLAGSGLVDAWRPIHPLDRAHTREGVHTGGGVSTARIDSQDRQPGSTARIDSQDQQPGSTACGLPPSSCRRRRCGWARRMGSRTTSRCV
jgi:hypothetical protein